MYSPARRLSGSIAGTLVLARGDSLSGTENHGLSLSGFTEAPPVQGHQKQ